MYNECRYAESIFHRYLPSSPRSRIVLGALLTLVAFCLIFPQALRAQVVRVEITPDHAVNRFVPKESLGSGVDRIPVEAIDKVFTKPILNQVFAAGWQPVTYRQSTELSVEA